VSNPTPIIPLLDEAHARLRDDAADAPEIVASLARALRVLKRNQSPETWEITIEQCRSHTLREVLHEDPLTERAFRKPRGYQGDGELLDIIYERDWRTICDRHVTTLGEAIFSYTINCKAPAAVRIRRDMLAGMIDETCERTNAPHILSVACGHLREANQSAALRAGRVGRFVGLDQDPHSIELVERELSRYGVEPLRGSIKLLLAGPLATQTFDFIYAAGLYDYLEDRLSQRLTERMFQMLRPGGRLLIANYLPDIDDVGYMETYMGWRLIYRDADAMTRLASGIQRPSVATQRTFHDPSDTIVFLQLDRDV